MVNELSQKKLEEYSTKINKLIEDTKYSLTIPVKEVYDNDTITVVDENWKRALTKIGEAQKLIQELLNLNCAVYMVDYIIYTCLRRENEFQRSNKKRCYTVKLTCIT